MLLQSGMCGCGAVCGHEKSPFFDEIFAYSMAHGMEKYESTLTAVKKTLFSEIKQQQNAVTVLEVGIGTAPNFKYYANEQVCVIGVDPNLAMVPYAEETAKNFGLQDQMQVKRGVVESLPISDASVDYVVASLVFCSVKDVDQGLKEIKRVLRPGGKFFFVEHVVSPNDDEIRRIQNFLNPLQIFFADGCHLNRDTLQHIQHSGFATVNANQLNFENLGYLGPHIAGYAVV